MMLKQLNVGITLFLLHQKPHQLSQISKEIEQVQEFRML